jgi:hypothetical protein
MTPGSPVERPTVLFAPIRAVGRRLHEREILRIERTVLDFLIAEPAPPRAAARAKVLLAANVERLKALSRDPFTQFCAGARALLHALPGKLRDPLSRLARAAVASRPEAGPKGGAGPEADQALAVPFGPAFPAPSLKSAVGVVAHVFYPELAPDIREYLEAIPGPVELYLSTDEPGKAEQLRSAFAGWAAGRVEVRLAPNRGRDVAPKLITFADVYDRHEVVLHIHSKKSPHDSDLKLWREFVFETLMGGRAVASSILALFEQFPEIGMVAPQHYFAVRNGIGWGRNWADAESLARGMGLALDPDVPFDFPSGSMFWARSAALQPLLDLHLTPQSFPPEAGQEDETAAHAIERLYYHSTERAGLRWLKVCRPELAAATWSLVTPVTMRADVAAFLNRAPRLGSVIARPRARSGLIESRIPSGGGS